MVCRIFNRLSLTFCCLSGLTAFDFISDFEEWIECGYFNEEIKARLKGKLMFIQVIETFYVRPLTSVHVVASPFWLLLL